MSTDTNDLCKISAISHFGFGGEGFFLVLIVPVPSHCLASSLYNLRPIVLHVLVKVPRV